jgi:hypothetical protein
VWTSAGLGRTPSSTTFSFGVYAEALLDPGYREAKARTFVSIAPGYAGGLRWVEASVDGPQGMIESPQVALVSNNPYHLSTLRHLGRRFTLDAATLGVVVIKRPNEPPSPVDAPLQLRQQLRRHADQGAAAGVTTWSAPEVTLHGTTPEVQAGIDGEPVMLQPPITCEIRPKALSIMLPRRRPGVPEEPTSGRPR